jgi:hypothetical protein
MERSKDRVNYQITAPTDHNLYISSDSSLTTTNGFRIPVNTVYPSNEASLYSPHEPLYGITDAGSSVITIIEYIGESSLIDIFKELR